MMKLARSLILVVMMSALEVASASAASPAPPPIPTEALDNAASLQKRKAQLEAFIDDTARKVAPPPAFMELGSSAQAEFCRPLGDDQSFTFGFVGANALRVLGFSDKLLPGKRKSLIAGLAALVKSCRYAEASLHRAGYVLDYLYWADQAHSTGHEVADALMYRDAFYELRVANMALEASKLQNDRSAEPVSCAQDYLSCPAAGLPPKIFKLIGQALNPIGQSRAVFDALVKTLDLRQGSTLIMGKDMLSLLDNPDDVRVMSEFHDYLMQLQRDPRGLAEAHGGWKKLMQLTHGDPKQAIRVIGILASMRSWPMQQLGEALGRRHQLTPEKIKALYAGSTDYFLMNQLDERSALDGKNDGPLEYHFFYPPGYTTKNWKFYHWYSNAQLGCILATKGFSKDVVHAGITLLGDFYEYAELNIVYPSRRQFNIETRAQAVLEGADDVKINSEGGDYGARLCRPK